MKKLLKEANDNIMELIDEVIKTRCADNRGKDLCAKMLYPEIDIKCECNGNCCQNCKVSAMLEFRGIMMEKYFVDIPKNEQFREENRLYNLLYQ